MLGCIVTTMVPIGKGVVTNTLKANLMNGLGVEVDVSFVVAGETVSIVGYCMTPEGHVDNGKGDGIS